MNQRDLSVIVVTYNSEAFIANCLESIINSRDEFLKEILVVDNGSKDDTIKITSKFKGVKVICNNINMGFAGGNNVGLKNTSSRYVLFLNPDTTVKTDSIEKMLSFALKTPLSGVIGPKLLYPNGEMQEYYCNFYSLQAIVLRRTILGKFFNHLIIHPLMQNPVTETPIDWVMGSAMLVSRNVIESVGLFDERYKLYFEDVDLCYRIKLAGYINYYYPAAEIYHHHQRESANGLSKKTLWHIQSAIKYFNKFGWKFFEN